MITDHKQRQADYRARQALEMKDAVEYWCWGLFCAGVLTGCLVIVSKVIHWIGG